MEQQKWHRLDEVSRKYSSNIDISSLMTRTEKTTTVKVSAGKMERKSFSGMRLKLLDSFPFCSLQLPA